MAIMKIFKLSSNERIFYRGITVGETLRIDEPFSEAKGFIFCARKENSAMNYGNHIIRIVAKPEAKILYSETNEFWKLLGRRKPSNSSILSAARNGERVIDVVNNAVKKAKENRYDAISFFEDSDIGTIILNPKSFEFSENIF
jgi:hypothetical protein